jgi:cellulose synthase/poly-beta-1,6-N-acetylglucosamine synthase-like glycosyltransferase
MTSFFSYLLFAAAITVSIPVLVLLLEVFAAVILSFRIPLLRSGKRQRIAVLVPAHNEGAGILPTIQDIRAQLHAGDRIIVVADNCTDNTASVAASLSAEVIERRDSHRRGKGYALDWGVRHLAADPPEVVIVVDADCRLAPDTLDQLSIFCASTGRPVQALDLMLAPVNSPANQRVAEFAWRVKNWVRPLGLSALNLPCQLMGTGMAFPWNVIGSASLASGDIAEDLKLGLELALAGHPPLFCPSARVESYFPLSRDATLEQRRRWEQGHLSKILRMAPRLVHIAIKSGNFGLFILVLDLVVPPITLLGMLLIGLLIASSVALGFGSSTAPLFVTIGSVILYGISMLLCWRKYGRELLSSRDLFALPAYGFDKLLLYCRMLIKKNHDTKWVRTERDE